MGDGYWVPQYKDQLVKQVKGLLTHVRLEIEEKKLDKIERMNKKNLYGLRKQLIAELKCGQNRKEVHELKEDCQCPLCK